MDVLTVGRGPAGLTLAAQLATFFEIDPCIVGKIALGAMSTWPSRRSRNPGN